MKFSDVVTAKLKQIQTAGSYITNEAVAEMAARHTYRFEDKQDQWLTTMALWSESNPHPNSLPTPNAIAMLIDERAAATPAAVTHVKAPKRYELRIHRAMRQLGLWPLTEGRGVRIIPTLFSDPKASALTPHDHEEQELSTGHWGKWVEGEGDRPTWAPCPACAGMRERSASISSELARLLPAPSPSATPCGIAGCFDGFLGVPADPTQPPGPAEPCPTCRPRTRARWLEGFPRRPNER